MHLWIVLGLVIAAVALMAAINIGSSLALAEIGARPILAFTRGDGTPRIPVQTPGQPAGPGEARPLGGTGILFGYRLAYALPDGTQVLCTARFRSLACSGGWQAERAPARR